MASIPVSGKATACLLCGLLTLTRTIGTLMMDFLVLALPALGFLLATLVLGFLASVQILRSQTPVRGKTGIVVGIIAGGLGFLPLLLLPMV